jgi:FkbM family methyltransferase
LYARDGKSKPGIGVPLPGIFDAMIDSFEVRLPNGKVCYVTSATMRTITRFLRWETFEHRQYRRAGFELRADDTVVDVGANVGMFALWAEPQIPRGRLICVEPNPQALKCLTMNIRQNDLRNVIVVAAAAGSENGTMELVSFPGWEALGHRADIEAPWFLNGSRMARVARWLVQCALLHPCQPAIAKPIAVQQRLLSRILDEHGVAAVNFLKMDCEGSEYEVLRSLDTAHLARIERIVIEYHDFGHGRNHGELTELLRKSGFEIEVVHSMQERLYSLAGVRVGKIWAKRSSPT